MVQESAERDDEQTPREVAPTFKALVLCLLFGLTVVWAATDGAAAGMLWSVACLACGFVVGFLFGVPRVLEDEGKLGSSSIGRDDVRSRSHQRLAVNTNLTQTSDWLTKIIVGVGLVELKQIPDHLARAGEYIGGGLMRQASATSGAAASASQYASFSAGIVVYFSALGFLAGYLLTRMYFSPAFSRADEGLGLSENAKQAYRNTPLEQDGRKVQVSAPTGEVESLRRLPAERVPDTAEAQAIWARAQFDAGRYQDAAQV
jgi:hypothetical protein